eukprot:RCo004883
MSSPNSMRASGPSTSTLVLPSSGSSSGYVGVPAPQKNISNSTSRTANRNPLVEHPSPRDLAPSPSAVRGFRLPLRVVFVAVLCSFAVGPAIALWMVSWQAGQDALSGVQNLVMSSVEGVSMELQGSLIASVQSSLQSFVDRGEMAVDLMANCIEATEALRGNGADVARAAVALHHLDHHVFTTVKTFPWMQGLNILLFSDIQNGTGVMQEVVYGWFNYDLLAQKLAPTLYSTPVFANAFHNATMGFLCEVNSTSGQPLFCTDQTALAMLTYRSSPGYLPEQTACQWINRIPFSLLIGLPLTYLECRIPFVDRRGLFVVQMGASVYTISSVLLSLVPKHGDRLFAIFRTDAGTMIGASHGKFFSHSDIDYSQNNPFTNPPPISDFQLNSAVNS